MDYEDICLPYTVTVILEGLGGSIELLSNEGGWGKLFYEITGGGGVIFIK